MCKCNRISISREFAKGLSAHPQNSPTSTPTYCAHFEVGRSHDDLSSLCAIKAIVHSRKSRDRFSRLKHFAKTNGACHRCSGHARAPTREFKRHWTKKKNVVTQSVECRKLLLVLIRVLPRRDLLIYTARIISVYTDIGDSVLQPRCLRNDQSRVLYRQK